VDKISLGDRMKNNYKNINRVYLTRRMPLIIRLDGVAFHTLTKKLNKPHDENFKECMMGTAKFLVENIMGAKLAYVQSDEISILITDYDELTTEAWFGKNLQKIVSVSASMATLRFNQLYNDLIPEDKRVKEYGLFDSRAFVIPKEEVVNYFIFRMNDATRNSIQGLGQAMFSHKEMHGMSCNVIQDRLMLDKGINWNDTPTYFKRGGCVYKSRIMKQETKEEKINRCINKKQCDNKRKNLKIINQDNEKLLEELNCYNCDRFSLPHEILPSNEVIVDYEIPIFTKDRSFIEQFVNLDIKYATNRMVRVEAGKLLDSFEDDDVIKVSDTSGMSIEKIIKHTDMLVKKYADLVEHGKYREDLINTNREYDLFEHDKYREDLINTNREYDLQLKGYKDGEYISVTEGSIVICHLVKSNKMTQPLRVHFSGEHLMWVFGNHTMTMLKELDGDVRFTLVER